MVRSQDLQRLLSGTLARVADRDLTEGRLRDILSDLLELVQEVAPWTHGEFAHRVRPLIAVAIFLV